MINLLEKTDQQAVKREYYRRLVVVASLMVMALLAISLLVIGAFYGSLLIQKRALENNLTAFTKDSGVKSATDFTLDQELAGSLIEKIASDKQSLRYASVLLEAIGRNRPAGVKLATIGLTRGTDNRWQMKLTGQTARRQDLIDFTDALKRDQLFAAVDSPFSNLIKEYNSEFVINLILSPQNQ